MLDSFIYFILYTYQARIFIASTTTSASILYCYIYIYWYTYTYLHILHIHLHPHLHMEASQDGGTPSPHPWNIWGISMSNARREPPGRPRSLAVGLVEIRSATWMPKKRCAPGGKALILLWWAKSIDSFLAIWDLSHSYVWCMTLMIHVAEIDCFFCWTYICVWFEIVSLKHFSSCVSPQNDES